MNTQTTTSGAPFAPLPTSPPDDVEARGRAIAQEYGRLLASWDDLRDRLQRAAIGLDELVLLASQRGDYVEVMRLRGKSSGVGLALSYMADTLPKVEQ